MCVPLSCAAKSTLVIASTLHYSGSELPSANTSDIEFLLAFMHLILRFLSLSPVILSPLLVVLNVCPLNSWKGLLATPSPFSLSCVP